MASGCCLVASDLEMVRELAHAEATAWVDHRNTESLVNVLKSVLSLDPEKREASGRMQRQHAMACWSRKRSLRLWQGLLGI